MANTWDPTKTLVQDTTATPLSRDAFIDPATGAERPINNPVTNPNWSADVAKQEQNAVINRKIDAIAHDTTLTPEVRQTQMANLQSQKTAMTGITPEMRQQITEQQNLPQNQYVPVRDIKAEEKNANKFGLDSSNPADVVSGLTTTYNTPQINKILLNGEVDTSAFSTKNLQDLGLTNDRINQLIKEAKTPEEKARIQDLYKKLQDTGVTGAQAESVMNATSAPTNGKLDVLSEALNAKSNYKNQNLGISDLFKTAGLSGYSVLAQSLNQRMNEMQDKSKSAQNAIAESGSKMVSAYKAITDNYNKNLEAYNKQMEMLLKIDQSAKDQEAAIDMLNRQTAAQKEIADYKAKIDAKTLNKVTLNGVDYMVDGSGKVHSVVDEHGNTIGGNSSTTSTPIKSAPAGTMYLGEKLIDQDTFNKVMNVGGWGGQCGTWASTISTAKKVGNTWAEKLNAIDKRDAPKVGDKLLIPLGGANKNSALPGHVAVVTAYDATTGDIQVVQSNMDLKGTISTGTYNLNTLKKQYGNNFGFASGDLKSKAAQLLSKPGAYLEEDNWASKMFKQVADKVTPTLGKLSSDSLGNLANQKGDIQALIPAGYKQYGLLSNTDFDPSNEVDKKAQEYIKQYITMGIKPSQSSLIGNKTASGSALWTKAVARADQLYTAATGNPLPDLANLTNNKKLIASNNAVLNKNEVLANTIASNFKVAIEGEMESGVNRSSPLVNNLVNYYKNLFEGDPDTAAASVSNGTVTNEFSNLMSIRNASGTTVADKELAEALIPFGSSITAQKAVVSRLAIEAENIHSALKEKNAQLWTEVDPLETQKENINRQNKLNGNTNGFYVRDANGNIVHVDSEADMQPGDVRI